MSPPTRTTNTISFELGDEATLAPLYPHVPPGCSLADCIDHSLNQTLLRDMQFGAWAYVGTAKGQAGTPTIYHAKITTPDETADIARYASLVPAFLNAVATARRVFDAGMARIQPPPEGVSFLPPFGLAMMNAASIQLLHYPPSETLNYMDYLYSPTNRRWENLLGCNGFPGARNTLLESIVDLLPLAANGGAAGAAAIKPFGVSFQPYVEQMLSVLLRPTPRHTATQPVVAYGGPVMDYLQSVYLPNDLGEPVTGNRGPRLMALSLVLLPVLKGGPSTPVLCANHPAQFMYYDPRQKDDPDQGYAHFRTVLQQDLIAAGWQGRMSDDPEADPVGVLQELYNDWTSPGSKERVDAIFDGQTAEFG